MKTASILLSLAVSLFPLAASTADSATPPAADGRPLIVKKGTVDLDLCETTPFVFNGKLYRLEWHRSAHCLRIMDHDTQTEVSHFGDHLRFPCAYAEGGTVYVIATTEDKGWCGTTLKEFTSTDLTNWQEQVAYQNPQFMICNTSVCQADNRYVMSLELAGGGYSGRFLESKDLRHWTLLPAECALHGKGSPHLLRWADGWFYEFSTKGGYPSGYVLLLQRSRDLKQWESSPFNPVMFASADDRLILNQKLTPEQRNKIAHARNCDNSDIDFCEYKGKLVINYNWGDQQGDSEFIAEAEYAGGVAQFLEGWFPSARPKADPARAGRNPNSEVDGRQK